MAHWYNADPHFGHDNIIKLCDRPFPSIGEMDAVIRANYASCIGPDDDFWIVGDLSFGRMSSEKGYLEKLFRTLPGRKHLVLGNHDNSRIRNLPWASVQDIAEVQDGEHRFVLCHYPMITWHGARRGALQLFGHVHGNWEGTRNSLNVGVDVWNFMPVRARDIVARAETLPVNVYWEKVEPRADLR